MIREDARGRRAAIVADYLVNPDSAFYAAISGHPGPVFDVLVEDGWGIMKPPPHILGESVGRPAASTMAGDAVDYLRHKYCVVILAVEGLPGGLQSVGRVGGSQIAQPAKAVQLPLPCRATGINCER